MFDRRAAGAVLCSAVIVTFMCAAASAQGVNIIWVHEDHGPGFDVEWREFLTDQGHTVDNRDIRDIDQTIIDELNQSELVIFSRDIDSGQYDDSPEEIAAWNGLTAPMIIMTPYVLRSSRWRLVDSTGIVDTTGTLEAVVPDHPIFQGGVLDAMNQVDMWDEVKYGGADNIDLLDAADIGNGTRLAVDPGTNLLWAAYWDAGVEFYPGSGQFAGGRRLYLSGGSDDDPVSWGGKNYTPQADQILLNAIEFMAVPSGLNPGDFNSDGAIDLADFGVLANNFGTGNTFEQGDNNRDGRVDLRDFVQFVDLFNAAQGGAGAAAVPEPNSLVLVSLGTLLMASIPRRRKRSRESFRS